MKDQIVHRGRAVPFGTYEGTRSEFEMEERLASNRLTALLAVEQRLAEHPAEAPNVLTNLLCWDLDVYAHRRRVLMIALSVNVAAFATMLAAQVAMPKTDVTGSGLGLVGPAVLSGLIVLAWFLWNRRVGMRMHNAICLLQTYPGPVAAGVLLRAYGCAEPDVAFDAADLACTILPSLSRAEANDLAHEQRRDLVRALRSPNMNLAGQAVRVVQRARDTSYRREVQHLAACPYWIAGSGTMWESARACLDTLAVVDERKLAA